MRKIKIKFQKNKKTEFKCQCGSELAIGNKSDHERTKKHQAWLKDQEATAETIQDQFNFHKLSQ